MAKQGVKVIQRTNNMGSSGKVVGQTINHSFSQVEIQAGKDLKGGMEKDRRI